jgi:hypothetical protein
MAPYHLLRIKQVEARTGLHRSQIYAWMKEDHFPQSIKKGIGYDLAGDSGSTSSTRSVMTSGERKKTQTGAMGRIR